MILKKRPIITWLLDKNIQGYHRGIELEIPQNPENFGILNNELLSLFNLRNDNFKWGLPEMVMPSFEKVMNKSYHTFDKVMSQLFHEFSVNRECGIIIKKNLTLVFAFYEDSLNIWLFRESDAKSKFFVHSNNYSEGNGIHVVVDETIIKDDFLFTGDVSNRINGLGGIADYIVVYVAVKKYVKVEITVIPEGVFKGIEGTPLNDVDRKKILNYTGQKVIVMDSKWFRKIINDNVIPVRGFFRMQNKKDSNGEWIKELIWVDPFIRHGYHRNAKIEEENSNN